MTRRRRAAAALPLLALLACARAPIDASTRDARTLHAASGSVAMHATWYPPTARTHPAPAPVVLVEPILFTRDLLTRDGGLVPWLESEGFGVWLVGADAQVPPGSRALAAGIVAMVNDVAREARVDRVDLIAPSLGAPAAMLALDALTSPASPVRIGKVVFLGGGLDYAYGARTFAARIASARGRPASAMCTLDAGAFCAHLFRDDVARTWLGALPPADPDELAPTNARYPFVTRFRELPVLFIAGKGDGAAPSESMFRTFEYWGMDEPDARKVPKVFFLAGRENGFDEDDDAFELLAGESAATEVWERARAWLEE